MKKNYGFMTGLILFLGIAALVVCFALAINSEAVLGCSFFSSKAGPYILLIILGLLFLVGLCLCIWTAGRMISYSCYKESAGYSHLFKGTSFDFERRLKEYKRIGRVEKKAKGNTNIPEEDKKLKYSKWKSDLRRDLPQNKITEDMKYYLKRVRRCAKQTIELYKTIIIPAELCVIAAYGVFIGKEATIENAVCTLVISLFLYIFMACMIGTNELICDFVDDVEEALK